jgi:transcription initiation factor TFIID subunit 12
MKRTSFPSVSLNASTSNTLKSPRPTAATPSIDASGWSSTISSKALNPNKQLHDLLRSIDPRYCLHPAVEELLLEMSTQFVQDVVEFSSKIAKNRRSTTLEAKDLQFCLAKNYGISLAGVLATRPSFETTNGTSSPGALNPLAKDMLVRSHPLKNSLHMHRMALKRKTIMKTKSKIMKGARIVKESTGSKKSGSSSSSSKKMSS